MSKPSVVCTKCSWVSFGVSKEYADAERAEFQKYYDTLSRKEQIQYYGKDRKPYHYQCQFCSGASFRLATNAECEAVYGSTISPVIFEVDTGSEAG